MVKSSPSACIEADPELISKVMLMPGDPLRAKKIAETYLEDPVLFNDVRSMFGYTGTYKGKKISVMGSGMGVPSMTLYAYELFNFYGVESIIRVGSAGAIGEDVKIRDIVIAQTASTTSNHAEQYGFPGSFAPCADFGLLANAVDICKERGDSVKVGSVFTTDMFYNNPVGYPDINKKARALGMYCVEMETAGLYLTAQANHKKALSILSISDDVFTGEGLSPQEIRDTFDEMMIVALETAWREAE